MTDHDGLPNQPTWSAPDGSPPSPDAMTPPGAVPPPPPGAVPPPPPGGPAASPVVPPSVPSSPAVPTLPPVAPPPTGTLPAVGPPGASVPGAPPAPPVGPADEMSFEEPKPPGRKSRLAVVGIAAGVVALGAAGVFAATQFRGSNSGGADSPEEVGSAMMAALEQEDMLGMIDLLLPGERETFREPMIDMVSELSRLEVLSADASLADLAGLDIEMTGEQTQVTPTNVDDISNIVMSAELTASLDGDQLPIGDLITDLAGDGFEPGQLDEAATTTDFDLPMTVVEHDGRWYLSVFHTAAEAARDRVGGEPIPPTGLAPRGGDSPEGAVLALLDGVEQLDLGKVIASINPNEAAALQRYAPLFLDDIEPALAEFPLSWQVTNTEFAVAGDGSKRFVSINALRIDGDVDGEEFSLSIEGRCAVVEVAGERFDTCELAEGQASVDDLLGETAESVSDLSSELEAVFADYDAPGLTVREVDGTWYVSPIGAGFDQMLALLRALDRDELDRVIETTQTVLNDVVSDIGGAFPLPGIDVGDPFLDDPFADDVFVDDSVFDDLLSDSDGSSVDADGAEPLDPVVEQELDEFDQQQQIATECFSRADPADIAGCLRENIDAGVLPAYYLTPELEFPECGVADLATGAVVLSELSDADFTAKMQAASTCFAELIAAGTIDEIDVSAEYRMPECAEGRNPWNFDRPDGDEFFDAWLDCVYG